MLDEFLPEYAKCFSQLCGKTSIGLLKKYGINGLRFTNEKNNEIKEAIRSFSKKRISSQKADYIEKVLRNSIGIKEALSTSEIELKIWIDELESNKKKIGGIHLSIQNLLQE